MIDIINIKETKIYLTNNEYINHMHYDILDSTQKKARDQRNNINENHWNLWTTDFQTKGITLKNNAWTSPKSKNISATYGFKTNKLNIKDLQNLPKIVGLCIVKLLNKYNIKSRLKWVNDILVEKKKICGILVDSYKDKTNKKKLIILIGIGINVNCNEQDLKNIDQEVTSMQILKQKLFVVDDIVTSLSYILHKNINDFLNFGFSFFLKEINQYLEKFDDNEILFEPKNNNKILIVRIKGISSTGGLILEDKSKNKSTYFIGKIKKIKSNITF